MKAYVGKYEATGMYYAMSDIPRVTQWGATPDEAWAKLDEYLRRVHGMALVGPWKPFPKPEPGLAE